MLSVAVARCSKCQWAWPNPEGCTVCNPERLDEAIAELRRENAEADDLVSDAEHAQRSAEAELESEREAFQSSERKASALRASLILVLRRVGQAAPKGCGGDGVAACSLLELCSAWHTLGFGDHWPGWKQAQVKLGDATDTSDLALFAAKRRKG